MIKSPQLECGIGELDLFNNLPVQTSVKSGSWTEIRPISALAQNSLIEFVVSGNGENYLDLRNSRFCLSARVVKSNGENLDAGDKIAPVNFLLHSIFRQVDVYLNGVLVSHADHFYPYRAFLEKVLTYDRDTLRSQGQTALYEEDRDNVENTENAGWQKRSDQITLSKTIQLQDRIHSDLFLQDRYVLNGVDLRIVLNRHNEPFFLQAPVEEANNDPAAGNQNVQPTYKLIIDDAYLMIRQVQLNPDILVSHMQQLSLGPAFYPIRRIKMKTYSIASGTRSKSIDNIFLGQLPTRLVVGFVKNRNLNGDYLKYPFDFSPEDVSFLSLNVNGLPIPKGGIRMNFRDGNIMEGYSSIFSGTNSLYENFGSIITPKNYQKWFALYAFDLSPELCHRGNYKLVKEDGAIRLEVQFAFDLPETVNALIYGEFENQIAIDKNRNVFTDF